METFQSLTSLTLDYSTLCREIILSLLNTMNESLELLEIHVQDSEMSKAISEEYWKMLKKKFPKLNVTLYFRNINKM